MAEVIFVFVLLMVAFSGWGVFIIFVLNKHYDGEVVISTTEEGKTIFGLELEIDPDEIKNMSSLLFKVRGERTMWNGGIDE